MKREEIISTLTNAREKAVNCFMLLGDYQKEMRAKDGKLYDSRVHDFDKYITINGERFHYHARICNIYSDYARFDFYFTKLNNDGYTIHGTNDAINGEYLGQMKWVVNKEGKTKQYFDYAEFEPKIDAIKLMLTNDISKTTDILHNLGDYIYHINALREEQKKIAVELSQYTKPRAYFNKKNLGEMV